MALAIVIGFTLFGVGALYFFQGRIIYFPSAYSMRLGNETKSLTLLNGSPMQEIHYETSDGRQTAFYIPPRQHAKQSPDRVWVLFSGNASLVLDLCDLIEREPDPRAGFLMVDYPGYGLCEGKPSPQAILNSSRAALSALAEQVKVRPETLYRHLNILGASLGTAAALQLAAQLEVEKVVLISPFTSLLAMARRSVGWPLCNMLTHRFDNRARLAELARRPNPPAVTIIHGDADPVVPVEMGRELARDFSQMVDYHEIKGGDHSFILDTAAAQIREAMAPTSGRVAANNLPGKESPSRSE